MIAHECKHTLPMGTAGIKTITVTSRYACIFCHVEQLERDLTDQRAENTRLMSILGLSMSTTAAERLERLERMEPLRTVLRSWDWSQMHWHQLADDKHLLMRIVDAFAHVEAAENEAAKAKEPTR